MRHSESTIGLIGLALVVLAWLVPQDRIGYEVKFALLGFAIAIICLSGGLYVRGWWLHHGKTKALNDLSLAISHAIRDLVNKPRRPLLQMGAFAIELSEEYKTWCEEVDQILGNTAHFPQSDLLHFQRLGFIQPIQMTGHPAADHTLAMLNLKLERLREIIAWHKLKA
jgi:hypothetical protein